MSGKKSNTDIEDINAPKKKNSINEDTSFKASNNKKIDNKNPKKVFKEENKDDNDKIRINNKNNDKKKDNKSNEKKDIKKIASKDNKEDKKVSKKEIKKTARKDKDKKITKKIKSTIKNKDNKLEEPVIKKKKRRKLKKKPFFIVLGIFILILSAISGLIFKNYNRHKMIILRRKQEKIVETIKSHYNEYVLVNEDSKLYQLSDDGAYVEYGIVYKDTELILEDLEITYQTKYFYSSDLESYIEYNNLTPIDELKEYNNRYKNYIVFNKNIVTNDEFTLYDTNKVYTIKKSMTFPIIINNYDGKYYVEFNNRLLYLLKDDIKEIKNVNNTNVKNASKVTTLCYHRVYDTNEKCNDKYICKKKSTFAKEMAYLHNNKYLSLTMEEVYLYLSGMIQIPRKSVVVTLDDGYLIKSAISVLEEYQVHATSFIKTVDFVDNLGVFDSPYLEKQSHTHRLHVANVCKKETSYQQGGAILCYSKDKVLDDLKTSRDTLNGAIALAFPFYDFNERAISLVKEAGFKLAFIGTNGVSGRATPGINLYKIPRITIWDTTSFNSFIGYVTN